MTEGSVNLKLGTGCLYFDGDDDRVNCGSSQSIMPTGAVTASIWINPSQKDGTMYVFARSDDAADEGSWSICLSPSGSDDSIQYLNIVLSSDGTTLPGTSKYYLVMDNAISKNTWQHIAFTWTWSGSYSGLRIYVNGEESDTIWKSYNAYLNKSLYQNYTTPVTIGGRADFQYEFKGRLYDARLYNRALTPGEIRDIYNRKHITDGLIGHWKCNDNYPNKTVKDWAGTNDGTISGATWSANDNFNLWCTRWDEGNWDVTIEVMAHKQDRDMIAGAVTPGAVAELYNILGTPYYRDITYNSGNTVVVTPIHGFGISSLRQQRKIGIKRYSDTHLGKELFSIKLEGYRLDT